MANFLNFVDAAMTPASAIPAQGTGVTSFTLEFWLKPKRLDGTTQYIFTNRTSSESTSTFFGLMINSSNVFEVQCGLDSSQVTSSAISVNTYYNVRVVATGLNSASASLQGTLELFVNDVSQGTTTPRSDPFLSHFTDTFKNIGGRYSPGPDRVDNPFEGVIEKLKWIYNAGAGDVTHEWTSDASDRTNTGTTPVFTATQGGVNLVATAGTDFSTDGSDWVVESGGADADAPVWTVDPAVSATSDTGHSFDFTATDASTIIGYAVRLASGATAPTASQIIAGTDASDVALAADAKWSGSMTTAVSKTATFTGGDVSTEYDYYFAVEDSVGNESLVKTVTATTGAGTIAVDGGTVTAGAAFTGTYSGIASLASPITFTDTQGNTLNVTITDDLDGTFSNATMPALPTSGSASSILFGTLTVSGNP